MSKHPHLPAYTVGETDTRPWGSWEVLKIGNENGPNGVEEFCIKHLTLIPGGILSLQSHTLRREEWTVLEGEIEVTRDKETLIVKQGETIHLPCGCIHRATNHGSEKAIIHETQRGVCREDDIIRYEDVYGRVAG